MKTALFLIAAVCLLASCRSSRPISKAVIPKDTVTTVPPAIEKVDTQALIRGTLKQIANNSIGYKTFSAKVNVDYEGGNGKKYDVNANVRMYKDSVIWVSVNAVLGIEALRLLITKDSVKLLNKLEKTYVGRSVGYLQEVTSLPLDLKTLQELIIGNPVYLDSNIIRYSSANNVSSLISLGQYFKNFLTVNAGDGTLIRSKLDDTDPARSRTADLTYGDYENKKGPLFSTKRQIVVAEKTRLDIKLEFKNYNFNEEVSFPFSVPKNYKRD
ncbi:MAG TPA: DUF4292 domain-containing protein [Flavisolibacter sp.]|jgi:hypothetical protein|nr:DUF4292 domain-containing protein [Flavisolibacter sp.]